MYPGHLLGNLILFNYSLQNTVTMAGTFTDTYKGPMKDQNFDQPGTLLKAVVADLALRKDPGLVSLCKDTGVPYFWLRKVARNEIKNPSVNRVQFLYEHITGTKLGI